LKNEKLRKVAAWGSSDVDASAAIWVEVNLLGPNFYLSSMPSQV
jgi:hypothetical protein